MSPTQFPKSSLVEMDFSKNVPEFVPRILGTIEKSHIGSMGRFVYLPIHEWLIFEVNVGTLPETNIAMEYPPF